MIENLHKIHHECKPIAKMQACDYEFDVIQRQLIDYLNKLRQMP